MGGSYVIQPLPGFHQLLILTRLMEIYPTCIEHFETLSALEYQGFHPSASPVHRQ